MFENEKHRIMDVFCIVWGFGLSRFVCVFVIIVSKVTIISNVLSLQLGARMWWLHGIAR